MQSPPSGTTYKNMVELDEGGDDKYLRKALFYGYGGPGWGHTFNGYNVKSIMEKYGCSSETSITWLTIYMMANPDLEVRFLQPLKIC